MTEYLFNAVSQRVQSEGAPTVPAVVGFRSFGSSFQTVYNIAFKHELTDACKFVIMIVWNFKTLNFFDVIVFSPFAPILLLKVFLVTWRH